MNSVAHIEINVSDLQKSTEFYSMVLSKLKWKLISINTNTAGYKGEDNTHIFLKQTEELWVSNIFHRKHSGLNHIAFRVGSKQEVEEFGDYLKMNSVVMLYRDGPEDYSKEYGMAEYYAVFFEDPDRIKLEVVFMK